jgi:hypothetical protein
MHERGEKKATRQCWECLKRRLVCDHTLPHCKKCLKAGRECSGYDDAKPLQWIQPGMVISRRRKKDRSPKVVYTIQSMQDGRSSPSSDTQDEEDVAVEPVNFQSMYTEWKVTTKAYDAYAGYHQGAAMHELHFKQAATSKEVARIFETYGRARIEEVVAKGSNTEAQQILRSKRDPLNRLKRLLMVLHHYDLPAYDFLSTETCAVVQAVQYCKPLAQVYHTQALFSCNHPQTYHPPRHNVDLDTNNARQHPYLPQPTRHLLPRPQPSDNIFPPARPTPPPSRNAPHHRLSLPQPLHQPPTPRYRPRNNRHQPLESVFSPWCCAKGFEPIYRAG